MDYEFIYILKFNNILYLHLFLKQMIINMSKVLLDILDM